MDPARLVARFAKAIGLPPQRAVKAVDRAAKGPLRPEKPAVLTNLTSSYKYRIILILLTEIELFKAFQVDDVK